MDQCPHYRACRTNLEAELQQRDISGMNLSEGMFSEDLYDEVLIELTELIDRISPNDIRELWAVSRIDRQKHHFVIIFGNASYLCTCLTLINYGIICHHFFAVLLESEIAQFHIGILAKRWFNDRVIQKMKRSVMNVQFRLEMVKILVHLNMKPRLTLP
ncbi:hypothetical protein C2G38_1779248 [Gigaspora rosea]|uniref:SWIM-type domain-containing protein n=1 Tax=Gigaspora rosea TaxID=44941 RepID=A0A397UVY1_9GLOM|nr:hypothetical protein C2G38_1779248 [Gigaspora rosea]